MKRTHRFLLGIGGLLLALFLLWLLWYRRRQTKEGFQALNVSDTSEPYLIYDLQGRSLYTQEEARAKCKEFGGTLATVDQVLLAQDASANWCGAGGPWPGWTEDSTSLYYPTSGSTCRNNPDSDICQNGQSVKIPNPRNPSQQILNPRCGLRKRTAVTPATKAGAICYGIKPPQGGLTVANIDTIIQGAENIRNFNDLAYSLLETDAIQAVLNPKDTLTSYNYTISHALYALSKYKYNTTQARQWLDAAMMNPSSVPELGGASSLNTFLRNQYDKTPEDTALTDWINSRAKSCEVAGNIQTTIKNQLATVKRLIQQVRDTTTATFYAKKENMNFQKDIASICRGLTETTSPACRRLASIDMDIFYSALSTNQDTSFAKDGEIPIFQALEELNLSLAQRECEIQMVSRRLQILMEKALQCSTVGSNTVTYDVATLKQYYIQNLNEYYPERCSEFDARYDSYVCPPTKTQEECDKEKRKDTRFLVRRDIGFVTSELLKSSLDELSPYYNEKGYEGLFTELINKLSLLLRLPTMNDLATATANFDAVRAAIGGVAAGSATPPSSTPLSLAVTSFLTRP